ncbi:MAG: hypothetical protein AAGF12_10050 [Myxococcota bacterium]
MVRSAFSVLFLSVVVAAGCAIRFDLPAGDASCRAAENGAACDDGLCVDGTCCTGCVVDGRCLPGDQLVACGLGGTACQVCDSGRSCVAGACVVSMPATRPEVGAIHSCAMFGDAGHCWGESRWGQLGRGPVNDDSVPAPVLLSGPLRLAPGQSHTCGIAEGDRLYCWGLGEEALGAAAGLVSDRPVLAFDDRGWSDVSAGYSYTCAIRDGTVECFGDGPEGQLGHAAVPSRAAVDLDVDAPMVGVSAGPYHACAWVGEDDGGAAFCWGRDEVGQIGSGEAAGSALTPRPVVDTSGATTGFRVVTAGTDHSCGIRSSGTLWCWGGNEWGQLGDGASDRAVATEVSAMAGAGDWTDVSAGHFFTCGVRGGGLFCWGANGSRQLGEGTEEETRSEPTPIAHPDGRRWVEVDASRSREVLPGVPTGHVCATDDIGELYCWGSQSHGQVGLPQTTNPRAAPSRVRPP